MTGKRYRDVQVLESSKADGTSGSCFNPSPSHLNLIDPSRIISIKQSDSNLNRARPGGFDTSGLLAEYQFFFFGKQFH